MTQKDFVQAAAMLRQQPDGPHKDVIIAFLVRFFADDNPRFNERRFRVACRHTAD